MSDNRDFEIDRRKVIHVAERRFTDRFSIPQYTAVGLPTAPVAGSLFYDETRKVVGWWDGSVYEYANTVADDVKTTTTTVANTTDRTLVFNADIDKGEMVKGRTYQMDLMGNFSTANTSDRFTVSVDVENTTVAGIQNAKANVSEKPWSCEFTMTVRDSGESGTVHTHTKGLFNSVSADAHGGDVTIDTTTATTFRAYVQWSAANAGDIADVGQAHLKQMG